MFRTFAAKLYWSFSGVIALLLVVVAVGMKASFDEIDGLHELSQEDIKATVQLANVQSAMWQLRWNIAQFIAVQGDDRTKIVAGEAKTIQTMTDNLAAYENGKRTAEEIAGLTELKRVHASYVESRPKWFELMNAGKMQEAAAWRAETTTPFGAGTVKALGKQIELQQTIATARVTQAEQSARQAKIAMAVMTAIAVALGGVLSVLLVRNVTRPLRALERRLAGLAAGEADLTARLDVHARDEVGGIVVAFNRMMDKIQALVVRVRASANDVATAAGGLSATTAQIAQSSQGQNQAAAATAAAIEELTVSVGQVADHSRETTSISEEAAGLSERGETIAREASSEMRRVADAVRGSSQLIEALNHRSAEITGIVNVIKEVANQTNLLALNAAIEAARAGEQGRGFSVVADEVRKLAERTGGATSEISTMIEAIQREIANAVTSLEASSAQVTDGVARAEQVAGELARINAGAKRAVQRVNEIAAATQEQGTAANAMAREVERIAQMTEENSAAVQASSQSAQRLQALADGLLNEVVRFKA